uniref:18S rRNA (guanine-N(7))-methyltransferase n=1 Tax=Aphelinus abdominalis TaxID=297830 RepID=A0A481T0J7_9HYME|nr:hypothetical protein [Aphelinus abdominalis]
MSSRPEHTAPPEIFYNDTEAQKYSYNSRMIEIQEQMTQRAMELLVLPEDQQCLLLDIGCGSGLSGNVLEEEGHHWIGVDISAAMLRVALEREVEGDLMLVDMGQGMPFRAGAFDGAISISALQWICNIDNSGHKLQRRLNKFFDTLFACLSSCARAVFQFYPENDQQVEVITRAALRAGFFGGTVIDFPNSKKAKKFFLVLMTSSSMPLPKAINGPEGVRSETGVRKRVRGNKKGIIIKDKRSWIINKKKRLERQGKKVRPDSKYTGRKRSSKF